jgi:tRNA-splicing ligase RtcB
MTYRDISKPETRVPIYNWAADIEGGALEQATNLANLPFAIDHVALMPDAHQGYGMPVGGVLFADKAVVPYAIGVDIGCGVALIETSATTADLTPDLVTALLAQIARDVPVGNGPQAQHHEPQGEPFLTTESISEVADKAGQYAAIQLGTLGGGNHFLELQRSDDGRVWFMLHSGSRSLGKKICDHWHKVALGLNRRWHSVLPHDELAYLPWGTEEAKGYWADMTYALAWAEENRRRMIAKVVYAFGRVLKAEAWQVLDVHHNYAAWEAHRGKNGIVHRKGAVRARSGETVLIPGSMGTASYVAEGLGAWQSFETCQHGAGRARSRGATRKMTTLADMDAQLSGAGVTLVTPNREAVIDESVVAYKDIEAVMAASADLIRPLRKHYPIGVVKG